MDTDIDRRANVADSDIMLTTTTWETPASGTSTCRLRDKRIVPPVHTARGDVSVRVYLLWHQQHILSLSLLPLPRTLTQTHKHSNTHTNTPANYHEVRLLWQTVRERVGVHVSCSTQGTSHRIRVAKNDLTTTHRHEGRVVQLPQSHVQHNAPPPGRDGVGVGWVGGASGGCQYRLYIS